MAQNRATTFFDQLKFALEQYHDPVTLGERSPLAAPYFLGQTLRQADTSTRERGETLCRQLDRALETLWGETLPKEGEALQQAVQEENESSGRGVRYDCLMLELNYFKTRIKPAPRSQAEIYNDILHISRASHDRYLAAAVELLATALLRNVRPALRFEQPTLPTQLIGRADLLQRGLAHLQRGECLALVGVGGVGKTSLGLAIGEAWQSPAVFWYTVRLGVNDMLGSLLFALGYFLHRHGASLLWRQLVADHGQIKDFQLASGLAQSDLRTLAQHPLLCIDEIDLLRRSTLDSENPRHTQLLEFIESLRSVAPLLVIGQQTVIESDATFHLSGLSLEEVRTWLQRAGLPFDGEDAMRLHLYSAGNPRLLELVLSLHQQSEQSLSQTIDQLPHSPAVSALWQRLQQRLSQAERSLLCALSVFSDAAPVDAWRDEEGNALQILLQRQLVRLDGQGGLSLLPAVRTVIYDDLGIERQQQLHLQAAQIRQQRGEYTAAAYHLVRADQPEAAVALWFPQREEEIRRGAGGAALAIFEQVSRQRLSDKRAKQLAILRSTLYYLHGEPEKSAASVAQVDWASADEMAVDAARLWGNALAAQGRTDQALQQYDEGERRLHRLMNQSAQIYALRSMLQLRQRAMQQAWQDANLARFQAERLLGAVADQRGDYAAARSHYQTAFAIVEQLQHEPSLAQIHHFLGILHSRHQQIELAITHLNQAMSFYERIGDRITREYVRGNLAAVYLNAGDYAATIETAHKALLFFQQIGESFSIAMNASNLAEAHAQLNHFDEAQHFAELVLQEEEPHSHPYALFTLGLVQQRQAKWSEASLYFAQAGKLAQMNEDQFLLAYAERAMAEVALAQRQGAVAQAHLQEALRLFNGMGISEEIAKTEALLNQHNSALVEPLAYP